MGKLIRGLLDKYKNMPLAARASLWFVICGFLQKGISLITTPIFTRLFTTAEYGQYNTFNSWMNIIVVFATLKISYSAYMRGLIRYDEDKDRYTSSLLGLSMTLIGVFAVIYAIFHKQISALLELPPLMMGCMFVMMLMAVAFEFWSARQRVDFAYRKLVTVTLIMSVLNPLMGIVAVSLFDRKVEARVVEIAIVEICCYGPLLYKQLFKGKKLFDKKYWKYAVAFCCPLIPHYLSQTILNQSDRLMIQKMCGYDEAGIYSLAYNVASILVLVNTALVNSYTPWLFKKIKAKTLAQTQKVSFLMILIVAAANLALIAFAPEGIMIFGSDKYADAIWIIPPISIGVYFMFLYSVFASVEMYFAKTKYMMVASSVGALLNIALNYWLIPIFGYMAAAYTTLICYIVYSCLHMLFMKKICREELEGTKLYDLRKIFVCTLVFCVLGFLFMLTYSHTLVRYGIILAGVIGCLIFRKKLIAIAKQIMSLKRQ